MIGMFLAIALLALGLVVFDAYAQASAVDHGPFDLALLRTYGWVVGVSLLGGVATFYQKVKRGQARWLNIGELIGELVTSSLAGLLTFWLCKSAGLNEWLTAAFVGIGGHMGSRTLFLMERLLERWITRWFPNGEQTEGEARKQ